MIALILKLLPSWVTTLPWKGIAVALIGLFGFALGYRWEAQAFTKYKADQAKEVAALKLKAAEITTIEVTKYVDRVQVVHEVGKSIIKKVPVYVPRNVCVLPPGFRSLHDAAAAGGDLPDSPRAADASPAGAEGSAGKH